MPRTVRRAPAAWTVAALALSFVSLGAASGQAAGRGAAARHAARVCAAPAVGSAACDALVVVDASGRPAATSTPSGFGPAQLQSAYNLLTPSASAGVGRTIAIVDAYTDPTAASDLGVYRTQYGLPPCTVANGCFTEHNQSGGSKLPKSNASWAQEISLDLDMVSAICPNCDILLMAASSASITNLGTAVRTAAHTAGVVAVSNSYGGSESSTDTSYDSTYYDQPNVAVTASAGDSGYGVQYPAASRFVTAVGGTSLVNAPATARGWTETVWSGTGSGCSAYDPKPGWQTDAGCANRTVADVAADADPNTGVAVYDSTPYAGSSGWLVFGGTSVASPIIASTYGLGASLTPGQQAANLYAHAGSLNDVTSGTNGSCGGTYLCTGEVGYDGPTGLGTPNGTGAF